MGFLLISNLNISCELAKFQVYLMAIDMLLSLYQKTVVGFYFTALVQAEDKFDVWFLFQIVSGTTNCILTAPLGIQPWEIVWPLVSFVLVR